MQKLLISFTAAASLTLLSGCSSIGDGLRSVYSVTEAIPIGLEDAPLLYKPTILQGNVVDQDQVDKLKPGMSRRQVRFILGTPTLQDVFHDNRWDYPYTKGEGSNPEEYKYLSVYFENDRLSRIAGDLHPSSPDERKPETKPPVVSVPDWEGENKSLWQRTLGTVGLDD